MYHCDACGWDGPEPAEATDRFLTATTGSPATMPVCPECGEEVYETRIIREPMIDPERRPG
jgi:predicted RNA-binding Zn-ribbon protein involved in translation (DUF1610 family)